MNKTDSKDRIKLIWDCDSDTIIAHSLKCLERFDTVVKYLQGKGKFGYTEGDIRMLTDTFNEAKELRQALKMVEKEEYKTITKTPFGWGYSE